jgi:hypothetical protein
MYQFGTINLILTPGNKQLLLNCCSIVAQMHCKWFENPGLFIKIINIEFSS